MAIGAGERAVRTTSISTLWVDDDDLMHVEYRAGTTMTVERVREQLAAAVALAGERPMRVLADLRGRVSSADRAVRAELGGPESAARTIAVAMLVDSELARAMVNFFMSVTRPPFPIRMFTSEHDALAWLRTFPAAPRPPA
jgi:hypothetical protein